MARKLIYVDASSKRDSEHSIYKIALYDKVRKKGTVLRLKKQVPKNITEAEKFAIMYAIIYSIRMGNENYHILSDNQSAVDDPKIQKIVEHYKIGLSWIPREANMIADNLSKKKIKKQKKKVLNLLYFFMDMTKGHFDFISDNDDEKTKKIAELTQQLDELKIKVNNQKRHLAALQKKFSDNSLDTEK